MSELLIDIFQLTNSNYALTEVSERYNNANNIVVVFVHKANLAIKVYYSKLLRYYLKNDFVFYVYIWYIAALIHQKIPHGRQKKG